MNFKSRIALASCGCMCLALAMSHSGRAQDSSIGQEKALAGHLADGQEFRLSFGELIRAGESLFSAKFTTQDGAGRPSAKGTGNGPPLSDPSSPLTFPRNFNRVSGPDSNSCSGCHNEPFEGGGGDRATEVFVLGNRFDFITFSHTDGTPTRGATDERGEFVTLQTVANERKTVGMNGSGYIEMLARQMTSDLQTIRDSVLPGTVHALVTKGVSFGTLARRTDGSWDTSGVTGLTPPSLSSADAAHPPSLLILPFQQASSVVSLRQFTNNAFMQHFGMRSQERFPSGDEHGDGIANELTRADVTAAVIYQATLPVPGRAMQRNVEIDAAAESGESLFARIGCATCHVPKLPLVDRGWIFTEPNPFNPAGNLLPSEAPLLSVDLSRNDLPGPRLSPDAHGIVWVPAFTDLRVHDITTGPTDPNAEALDQNQPIGSAAFFAGNTRFITRKLWGVGNSGPYMHHGKFTTIREAVLAHSGEADGARRAFQSLSPHDADCVIEFLKSLQILSPTTKSLIVDENGNPRDLPDTHK